MNLVIRERDALDLQHEAQLEHSRKDTRVEVKTLTQRTQQKATTRYLSMLDKSELRQIGDSEAILCDYYFDVVNSIGGSYKDLYDDAMIAVGIGWDVSKVKRIRQSLVRNQWIHRRYMQSRKNVHGKCIKEYQIFLGKELVQAELLAESA